MTQKGTDIICCIKAIKQEMLLTRRESDCDGELPVTAGTDTAREYRMADSTRPCSTL